MNYNKIEQYIPKDSLHFIEKWFSLYSIQLRITKDRKTKLGDYRKVNNVHQISINGNLNPQAFFFVLTHEFAHLKAFEDYKHKKILAHGIEWKTTFGNLLMESLAVYSDEIKPIIIHHAKNPRASVSADPNIAKHLINTETGVLYLEDLNFGDQFLIGQRLFEKGDKRKIRYLCTEKNSGKRYLINGLAIVNLRNEEE